MEVTEIAVAALVLLVGLLLLAVYLRRRYIARGSVLLVCAERAPGALRWRIRLARYDLDALYLYSLTGLGVRPLRRVERGLSGVGPVVQVAQDEEPPLVDDPVVLRCSDADAPFDLALNGADYTALRSWLESSPPGLRHRVA